MAVQIVAEGNVAVTTGEGMHTARSEGSILRPQVTLGDVLSAYTPDVAICAREAMAVNKTATRSSAWFNLKSSAMMCAVAMGQLESRAHGQEENPITFDQLYAPFRLLMWLDESIENSFKQMSSGGSIKNISNQIIDEATTFATGKLGIVEGIMGNDSVKTALSGVVKAMLWENKWKAEKKKKPELAPRLKADVAAEDKFVDYLFFTSRSNGFQLAVAIIGVQLGEGGVYKEHSQLFAEMDKFMRLGADRIPMKRMKDGFDDRGNVVLQRQDLYAIPLAQAQSEIGQMSAETKAQIVGRLNTAYQKYPDSRLLGTVEALFLTSELIMENSEKVTRKHSPRVGIFLQAASAVISRVRL